MYRIKCPSPSVKESAKLILDPRPDPDKQPNLLTARESLVGYADCVWSTSMNAFVSYPYHSMTGDSKQQRSHNSVLAE